MRTLPDGFRTNSATRFLTRSTGFTVSLGFGGGCGLSAKATSTFFSARAACLRRSLRSQITIASPIAPTAQPLATPIAIAAVLQQNTNEYVGCCFVYIVTYLERELLDDEGLDCVARAAPVEDVVTRMGRQLVGF